MPVGLFFDYLDFVLNTSVSSGLHTNLPHEHRTSLRSTPLDRAQTKASARNLPVLLQLDERRFAGYRGRTAVQILGRVRCVRHAGIHAGVRCARGPLVGAPQIRKVQRVGA